MSRGMKVNGVSVDWLADHASLRQALRAVATTIERQASRPAAVADMVAEAADRVLAHFRHEEDGGHLSQAVDAAPHLAVQAHGLLDEHGDLAARLNELRQHAAAAAGSADWWNKLGNCLSGSWSASKPTRKRRIACFRRLTTKISRPRIDGRLSR